MQTTTATITNLVPNPSFEAGTTGWLSYVENGQDAPPTLAIDATTAESGSQSLKITPGATRGFTGASIHVFGLTVGTTYTVSCYVKSA